MEKPRVGLWLLGAFGGVATTAALGLSAMRRGESDHTGLVTALPLFDGLDLDLPEQFVVGGHDVRRSSYREAVAELRRGAGVFEPGLTEACGPDLDEWSANVRSGTVLNAGATIARLANLQGVTGAGEPRAVVDRIRQDLTAFRATHQLSQVVVVNVASTEPPSETTSVPARMADLDYLTGADGQFALPASSLYAWAALELGWPYINFTPSLGASATALQELAIARGALVAGQDGKTGETLLKTVLAPMFARRNLRVLSWVGHNIFGNRDGLVLDDPRNKESKLRTKDQVVSAILGYRPRSHVSIEYIESLDDWKTAWDYIHFRGFLGVKMSLQFTWQGCDSVLAGPLVIDLARLALLAQRRGEAGIMTHLACFFKSPMGVQEHDFFKQFSLLEAYVSRCLKERPAGRST